MKLIMEPIEIRLTVEGIPNALRWRGQLYRVLEIQEKWIYNGQWWATPKLRGRFRRYFRLNAAPPGRAVRQLEIYQEAGQWQLSRLLD